MVTPSNNIYIFFHIFLSKQKFLQKLMNYTYNAGAYMGKWLKIASDIITYQSLNLHNWFALHYKLNIYAFDEILILFHFEMSKNNIFKLSFCNIGPLIVCNEAVIKMFEHSNH